MRTGLISVFVWGLSWGVLSVCAEAGTYSGGTGEPNDPYRIATANDLNDIGNHVEDFNKCFIMMNDISLADYNGTQFNIIGDFSNPFVGVFDGNGHTIANLLWSVPSGYVRCVGVFGVVGTIDSNDDPIGEVRNLGLYNADVNASASSDFVGLLVGFNDFGTIVNCYATGSVLGGGDVGGLVGYNWDGRIRDSHSATVTSGDSAVGGLLGCSAGGSITNCYSQGSVHGGDDTGGLVGSNGRQVSNCYSTCSVQGAGSCGGLVGYNSYGDISNCYAEGAVFGTENTGGLVGLHYGTSTITYCYSTGTVEGLSDVGGLVGKRHFGSPIVQDSFWDLETSDCNSSDGGVGLSTREMKIESTFTDAGWDFVEVWDIGEEQTYPFLRVYAAGDLNHDGMVNFIDVAILGDHWLEAME